MFNYGGLPFMQPLIENKTYFKFLIVPFALVYILMMNIEDLNRYLEMTFDGMQDEDYE